MSLRNTMFNEIFEDSYIIISELFLHIRIFLDIVVVVIYRRVINAGVSCTVVLHGLDAGRCILSAFFFSSVLNVVKIIFLQVVLIYSS